MYMPNNPFELVPNAEAVANHTKQLHKDPPAPSTFSGRYTFILWGDKFEEETASIFAAELRRVGICVKVIGITGSALKGRYGLSLTPDLTLSQALPLAPEAACVIVPCSMAKLRQLQNDPRVGQFIAGAAANQAQLVIHHDSWLEPTFTRSFVPPTCTPCAYPESAHLVSFARELAGTLMV